MRTRRGFRYTERRPPATRAGRGSPFAFAKRCASFELTNSPSIYRVGLSISRNPREPLEQTQVASVDHTGQPTTAARTLDARPLDVSQPFPEFYIGSRHPPAPHGRNHARAACLQSVRTPEPDPGVAGSFGSRSKATRLRSRTRRASCPPVLAFRCMPLDFPGFRRLLVYESYRWACHATCTRSVMTQR